MIRTKIVLGSIILASALLAGCSNSTEVKTLFRRTNSEW